LFNPLPAEALAKLIEKLHASLEQYPREVKIIYHNPISEDVLAKARFLHKLDSTHQYAIYSN
jgi:hypothetical protein